jgi:hypothetical protein
VEKRAPLLAKALGRVRAKIGDQLEAALPAQKADPAPQLSPAQRKAIEAALAAMSADDYATLLYDELGGVLEFAWSGAKDVLEIETGFDVPPQAAMQALEASANEVANLVVERDQRAMKDALGTALADGLGAKDAADLLKQTFDAGVHVYAEDGALYRVDKSDAWFAMVARTELQKASIDGAMALYEATGIKTVRIQAAEPCDECADYDDQVYPIDDMPDGGPPWHPNCRCVPIPDDEDLGDFRGSDEERAAARSGNKEAE